MTVLCVYEDTKLSSFSLNFNCALIEDSTSYRPFMIHLNKFYNIHLNTMCHSSHEKVGTLDIDRGQNEYSEAATSMR